MQASPLGELKARDPPHVELLEAQPEVVGVKALAAAMSATGRFALMPVTRIGPPCPEQMPAR